MVKLNSHKDKVLHRLKIARGQISKLIEMVEDDKYCVEVLHASLATQKALKKVDALVMENHLTHCAIKQAKEGQTERLVKELVSIYKYK
jgi:DNA-binding FrmR family transcriptional regulator